MRDTWNMTPDEAKIYILQNWFDGDENVNAFVCGDEEYTAMAIAVEALEAAKWYYPSRGEYPKEGEEVLFRCDGQNYLGTYSDASHYFDSRDMGSPADYVDCWQYIVPPKEEV